MRMTPDVFDELLETIAPLIEKKNTFWRNSISPDVRLAVTLRYIFYVMHFFCLFVYIFL